MKNQLALLRISDKNRKKLRIGLYAAVPFFAAAISHQAHADAPGNQPAAGSSGGLEEIVVTAQKRSENMQNVPIAVSAVTALQLAQVGVKDIMDLNIAVPSLNVTNTYGRLTLSLRGIGSSNVGPGAENPIALYIDGVYYASSTASILSLNNIADVEVLKGPQGTLFGRNATGGLIQVTTKDPTSEPSGAFSLTYASFDTEIVSAYLADGITDGLAADFAVYAKRQGDGWGHDLATGSQLDNVNHDISLRSKWVFTSEDQTKITLIADYETVKDTMLTSAIRGGSISPFELGVIQPDLGWNNDNDVESVHSIDSKGLSLRWDQKFDNLNFASISAYRNANTVYGGDLDGLPLPLSSFVWYQFDRQFTQEFQLGSDVSERFKWTTGLYYYKGDTGLDPATINIGYSGINYDYPTAKEGIQSEAGYLQGTYEIFDATNLTLGGRYTREARNAYDESILIYDVGAAPSSGSLTVVAPASKTFFDFTYRASIDHRFSDEVLAYISYNTGFKAGGFNVGSPGAPYYNPETLSASEIGIKTDLFDRRVRFNFAAFNYNYTNIQVQEYTNVSLNTINGAKARSYGVDADLTFLLMQNLQLTSGVTVDNPTFQSFPGCAKAAPQGGVALAPGSCSGNQLPIAAKVGFNTALDYTTPLPSGSLDLTANVYYNSGYFTDVSNVIHQSAYVKPGVSAKWIAPDGKSSIRVYGTNLTDRRVLTYGDSQGVGTQLVNYGEPRTFGITLGYDF